MKTFRLITLLALATLAAACADLPTLSADDASPAMDTGQGQLGGGTRQ